ncbi:NUDIX domain-containing protein [Bacillaceae bacterium Marseille-Q3522]|nr:NUDIX domain-containing protein [Bacillaceae bacterium Marseille-Q3522]
MNQKFNISELTANQPFCAGVILTKGEKILVTLNSDGLPDELEGRSLRIGGVGGGQEPDETIRECAAREAKEELSVAADIHSSPRTFFHDLDKKRVEEIEVRDDIKPFLFERVTNPYPEKPYQEGLPTGSHIYFALYLARVDNWGEMKAGDDVQGLLLVPLSKWDLLEKECTIMELQRNGGEIIHSQNLDKRKTLWLPADESYTIVRKLLCENRIKISEV